MNYINLIEMLPITQAIGWTVLHSLWQITLIALLLKLLLVFVPQKKTNLIYFLSLIGLTASLVWVLATFSNQWSFFSKKGDLFANSNIVVLDNLEFIDDVTISNPMMNEAATEFAYATFGSNLLSKVEEIGQFINPFMPYIGLLWYVGTLLFSITLIIGFFNLNQLGKTGIYRPSDEWLMRFEELKNRMGIRYNVRFSLSELIKEPITFYFFKPVVLAPISIFTGLTNKQVEVLLLHELAHIRRYDYVINVFQSIIEAILFFHPLVWWISKKIRTEREHCCDDLVLKINHNPMLYAEALTQIQLNHFSFKTNLAMSVNGKNKNSFSKRIFRLFGQHDQKSSKFKGGLILMALLISLGLHALHVPSDLHSEELTPQTIEELEILSTNSEAANAPKSTRFSEGAIVKEKEVSVVEMVDEFLNTNDAEDLLLSETILNNTETIETNNNAERMVENSEDPQIPTKKTFNSIPTLSPKTIASLEQDKLKILDKLKQKPKGIKKDTTIILLEKNKINLKHKFYENFVNNEDPSFIRTLYYANVKAKNKKAMKDPSILKKPARIYTTEGLQNSLIFTIKENGVTRYDTLQNNVILHDKNKQEGYGEGLGDLHELVDFALNIPTLEGDLPDGAMVYVERKNETTSIIGVILEDRKQVKIEVVDDRDKVLKLITDKSLGKGKHTFSLKLSDLPKGTHILHVNIDGEITTQLVTAP